MGAVYRARQKELDRVVALKILPPDIGHDAAFAKRFAREAKAMAKLNYPGIVTIYDFGRADGLYFFLMEFVDGVTLHHLLANGRVSAREALAIVPQICDALQFAHDQGIVHRDIKPENILLFLLVMEDVAMWRSIQLTHAAASARPYSLSLVPCFFGLLTVGAGIVIMFGAVRMRRLKSYGWSVAASILAMITPGLLVGLPSGIWALVVLSRREVRETFGRHHPLPPAESPRPSHGGGAWKVPAANAAVVVLVLASLVGTIVLSIALPSRSRQRARAAAQEASRMAAVEQKMTREVERRLRDTHISFRSVFVTVSPDFSRAECLLDGLCKEVSQNLFEDFVGSLDIRPAGTALWSVQGKGGLENVSFTVDTSSEMKLLPDLDECEWGPIEGDSKVQDQQRRHGSPANHRLHRKAARRENALQDGANQMSGFRRQ